MVANSSMDSPASLVVSKGESSKEMDPVYDIIHD